jgi:hypothetical protein
MPNVRSKIGQNKAYVVARNAIPLNMLNSSLAIGEQPHRRSDSTGGVIDQSSL